MIHLELSQNEKRSPWIYRSDLRWRIYSGLWARL